MASRLKTRSLIKLFMEECFNMLQSSVLVVVTVLLRSEMSLQCQTHLFHPTNPTPSSAPRHVYCNLKIAHVQLVDSGWLASVCFVSVEGDLGWLGIAGMAGG